MRSRSSPQLAPSAPTYDLEPRAATLSESLVNVGSCAAGMPPPAIPLLLARVSPLWRPLTAAPWCHFERESSSTPWVPPALSMLAEALAPKLMFAPLGGLQVTLPLL